MRDSDILHTYYVWARLREFKSSQCGPSPSLSSLYERDLVNVENVSMLHFECFVVCMDLAQPARAIQARLNRLH